VDCPLFLGKSVIVLFMLAALFDGALASFAVVWMERLEWFLRE